MKSMIVSFVAAATLLASSVSAVECGTGYGLQNGICKCLPGYYNDQGPGEECKPAPPGWRACGGFACFGSTSLIPCGNGLYAPGWGNQGCSVCPPGNICPSDAVEEPIPCVPGHYMPDEGSGESQCLECPPGTYTSDDGAVTCSQCPPGTYSNDYGTEVCLPCPLGMYTNEYGATTCSECPTGTYNNEYGATGCCNCCAGTFNDKTSQTQCFYCGDHTNPPVYNSPVRATSIDQCQAAPVEGVTRAPKGTCDIPLPEGTRAGDGDCPPEQGTGPTERPGKRRHLQCGAGFKKCPLYTGVGGFDCVDVKNDPEQCGGCVSIDGLPNHSSGLEGEDCTAIPNVSVVNCVKGKCIIENCRKGFIKSKDGKSCTPVSGLNVQEQQDAAKRNTHGRRWHVSHLEN